MKEQISTYLDDPAKLEELYRSDRQQFRQEFKELYPTISGSSMAVFWNERLNYKTPVSNLQWSRDLSFILVASLLAGFIAKIPVIFGVNEDYFYPRHLGFIFLPLLAAYFAWKSRIELKKILVIFGIMLLSLLYINLLPGGDTNDSFILACLHLPLVLWVLLGASFVGNNLNDQFRRLDFLKYNGDLLVMVALIVIAGGIMSGVTIGLFSLIGFHIEEIYFENVGVFGIAAAPLVATFLIRTNPQLVGKVSPVIARIFSPLVLIMLLIYLGAMFISGQDPYNDREFLIIFNLLLLGVMALIFFSVAESSTTSRGNAENWVLFLLSVVTIIVNGIALSAVIFRIAEWGITPNRAAVLGGNFLILINLVLVSLQLFKLIKRKTDAAGVGIIIARYLPVYFVWTLIVTFLFPLLFNFR